MKDSELAPIRQRYEKDLLEARERIRQIELKIKVLDEIQSELNQANLDEIVPRADYSSGGLTAATIDAIGKLCLHGKPTRMKSIRDFLLKHGYPDSPGLPSALNT